MGFFSDGLGLIGLGGLVGLVGLGGEGLGGEGLIGLDVPGRLVGFGLLEVVGG